MTTRTDFTVLLGTKLMSIKIVLKRYALVLKTFNSLGEVSGVSFIKFETFNIRALPCLLGPIWYDFGGELSLIKHSSPFCRYFS